MIDLHCHVIPGIDDGSPDLQTSLKMARMSGADGLSVIAWTPHISPSIYDNSGPDTRRRVQSLQFELNSAGIDCRLVPGCDAHVAADLVGKLRSGLALAINKSIRARRSAAPFPPPECRPPFFDLLAAGYVSILTHPERMSWADRNDDLLCRLIELGTWMHVTAGSLLGGFGPGAKHRAERMLRNGWVHIIASDAHDALGAISRDGPRASRLRRKRRIWLECVRRQS